MITVTRFDHTDFILNADLIEFVEARPDTHITLVTGKKLLVTQTPQEVVDRVVSFRQQVGLLPHPPVAALKIGEEHRTGEGHAAPEED